MLTAHASNFEPRLVCILGLGYIGLPTAAILASRGHTVVGVDINHDTVATINGGRIHIGEPELDLLVKTAVDSGRLAAVTVPVTADVFIICVPTPLHHDTLKPDVSYVAAAAKSIGKVAKRGNLIILESTSPPGTTSGVVGTALKEAGMEPGTDVFLAYCPERVLPGAILRECVENDRIIGGCTPQCSRKAMEFYHTFVQGDLLLTDCKTAETVKLVENASRDVQIAFANELSLLAHHMGLDVWEVIRLANRHPRVNVLQPGPGVGGHCIAVDPWFLVDAAPETASLIRCARNRNDEMPSLIATRIADTARSRNAKTIALLGMAYKNDIDDCRESPSVEIFHKLRKLAPESECVACEPNVRALQGVTLRPLEECLGADVIVVLVGHRDFKDIDWMPVYQAGKAILDLKGIVPRALVTQ